MRRNRLRTGTEVTAYHVRAETRGRSFARVCEGRHLTTNPPPLSSTGTGSVVSNVISMRDSDGVDGLRRMELVESTSSTDRLLAGTRIGPLAFPGIVPVSMGGVRMCTHAWIHLGHHQGTEMLAEASCK